MKILNLLLLLAVIALAPSCSSDDDNSMDSEMDSSCTKEISFIEDGNLVTMPIDGLDNGGKAIFDLKDPSPFNSQGVSRAFAIRMQSGTSGFDVTLELEVEDANSCIPTGVYNIETLDPSEGVMSFFYLKDFGSYVAGLGEGNAILEITKCDFENKLVSGKFSATLVNPLSGETIQISEGVFEDVCLE